MLAILDGSKTDFNNGSVIGGKITPPEPPSTTTRAGWGGRFGKVPI